MYLTMCVYTGSLRCHFPPCYIFQVFWVQPGKTASHPETQHEPAFGASAPAPSCHASDPLSIKGRENHPRSHPVLTGAPSTPSATRERPHTWR